ncbi:YrbL family protein [Cognatiyoonia sp. IB215446]|uniref:YrbL family protein n=1 Tax=Cognatiyoonia sp. IB215446 TaxID=3097355 RepID=UPI002A17BCBF|nr:YrbL family protein [Cognatiyoonia sp. IB215446]MDX8346760.1 YrbL family protein [Cognatiyoonia sp. IB215446]
MAVALNLSVSNLVASGVQRAVYLHPNDRTKLIKVLKPDGQMPNRWNFNGVMDRVMPSTRIRQIRKEYTEYLRVMLQHPEPDFRAPMSHMFGFVSTNVGLGCLTENVMGPDGSVGETLGQKMKRGTLTDSQLTLLNDTIDALFVHSVRASDLNPNNFVFGHRSYGNVLGPEECVLVDGFGDIHAIPVRSMGRWLNRIGLADSCKRLARNTKLLWDPKTRRFSHF